MQFEAQSGTKNGTFVKSAIDKVITNNKTKKDKTIVVIYEEHEMEGEEALKFLKSNLYDFKDYEVSYDYDEAGYICKMTIEKQIFPKVNNKKTSQIACFFI